MSTNRLFFALWPDDKVRRAIVAEYSRLYPLITGRSIPPENYHITLHFIGSVTDMAKSCMHEAAQTVSAEPFELTLDHFGFFDKARIFWLAPQTIPSALRKIQASLGDALSSCGYHGETRDYSPHVSLLRKAKSSPLDYPAFSINWKVKDFVLVESISTEGGVRYEVIARYPFNHSI